MTILSNDECTDVCFVIVHYRTPDLLRAAVTSLFEVLPEVVLRVVDNGPTEETVAEISRLQERFPSMLPEFVDENIGHGPGLDRVISRQEHRWYFCLDSDVIVHSNAFLEPMLALGEEQGAYGVGRRIGLSNRGFFDASADAIPALDPAYMLIKSTTYAELPAFAHHGQPVLENFRAVANRDLTLVDFPVDEHIEHLHRGTVDRHGYGLGIRGKWNYVLEKLGL